MKEGKLLKFLFFVGVLSSLSFLFTACQESEDKTQFGIFKVLDSKTVEMDGEINRSTLNNFNRLIERYPNVDKINMMEVPGSSDDEINLLVSKKVHQNNINTHLMEDGLIASGGVDFYLAGITRTKGNNSQIGVHSWSDGTNEATDFPRGHSNHQPYIDYYISVGFSLADAEDFYYFTIDAAPAASIHWMTESEIAQYNILQ